MAISDQIIELEQVKKGRNIFFIVMICVLAAASVTFALLWALKKPATEPPRVDAIVLAGASDLVLSSAEGEDPQYDVTVGGLYKVYLDIAVPETTDLSEVNTLIEAQCNPYGVITAVEDMCGLLDESNPARYTYTFRVSNTAVPDTKITLVLRSAFSSDVSLTLPITVKSENTATINIAGVNDPKGDLIAAKANEDGVFMLEKSSLPFFPTDLAGDGGIGNNEYYDLLIEQLGRKATDGSFVQIASGFAGKNNHYVDELFIEVKGKDDKDFTPMPETSNGFFGSLQAGGLYIQRASFDSYYYRSGLSFRATAGTKATIRITANKFNDSDEITATFEINFTSVNDMNVITRVYFDDPIGGTQYDNKTVPNVNIFAGNNVSVDLSDYISVKYKNSIVKYKKSDSETVGTLRMSVCNADGTSSTSNLISVPVNSLSIGLLAAHNVGEAYVRIYDVSTSGYGAKIILKISVLAPINRTDIKYDNSALEGNTEKALSVAAGSTHVFGLTQTVDRTDYVIAGTTNALKSEHIFSGMRYTYSGETVEADDKGSRAIVAPKYDPKTGKLINEDDVIVPSNSSYNNLKNGSVLVYDCAPNLSLSGKNNFIGEIGFKIGKNVKNGEYRFDIYVRSQKTFDDDYFKHYIIVFNVTRTADDFKFASVAEINKKLAGSDAYHEVTSVDNGKAKIYIRVGIGANADNVIAGKSYTQFSLFDLVEYYFGGDIISGESALNDAKFTVESGSSGSVNDKMQFLNNYNEQGSGITDTVNFKFNGKKSASVILNYYRPIESIEINNGSGSRDTYYSPKVSGCEINLADCDVLSVYDLQGKIIAADKAALYYNVSVGSGNNRYMLRRYDNGNTYYYFDRDVSGNIDLSKALFSISHNTAQRILTINVDLFAYTLNNARNTDNDGENDIDYAIFRVHYSAADIECDDDGAFTAPSKLSVSGDYKAFRNIDRIDIFTDKEFTTPMDKTNGTYAFTKSLGDTFSVHYAGIIKYKDASGVERTVVITDSFNKSLCVTRAQISPSEGAALGFDAARYLFTAEKATDDAGTTVKLSYGTVFQDFTVIVLNDARRITGITIESDSITLYAKNSWGYGYSSTARVKYKITYAEQGLFTSLESHSVSFSENKDFFDVKYITALPDDINLTAFEGEFEITFKGSVSDFETKIFLRGALGTADIPMAEVSVPVTVITLPDSVDMTIDGEALKTGENESNELELEMYKTERAKFEIGYSSVSQLVVNKNRVKVSVGEVIGLKTTLTDSSLVIEIDTQNRKALSNARVTLEFKFFAGDVAVGSSTVNILVTVSVPVLDSALQIGGSTAPGEYTATTNGKDDIKVALGCSVNRDRLAPTGELNAVYTLTDESGSVMAGTQARVEGGKIYFTEENGVWYLFVARDLTNLTSGKTYKMQVTVSGVDSNSAWLNVATTLMKPMTMDNPLLTKDGEGKYTFAQYNNGELDLTASLFNAGSGVKEDKTITYTVSDERGVTVSRNGSKFTPGGSSGTYKVTASYTDSDNGKTYSAECVVTVRLPVSEVTVSDPIKDLLKGDSLEIQSSIGILSGVDGVDPFSTDYTVASSDESVLSAVKGGGKVTLTGVKAGTATVTVTATVPAGSGMTAPSKTFTVTVYEPRAEISRTGGGSVLQALDTGAAQTFAFGASETKFNYSFDCTLTAQSGANIEGLFDVTKSDADGTVTVKLKDRTKLTAALLGDTFTLTVSGTTTNHQTTAYALPSASANFTLACEYSPSIVLKQNGAVITDGYADVNSAAELSLDSLPEWGSVVYSFTPAEIAPVLTGSAVSELKVGDLTITAAVTLFGKEYTARQTYRVRDYNASKSLTAKLYSGTQLSLDSNGAVTNSLATTVSADHERADRSDAAKIFAVIEYSGVVKPENAKLNDFAVYSDGLKLDYVSAELKSANGRYYYVATFRAVKAGTAAVNATATVGGIAYKVDGGSVNLTATEPEWSAEYSGDAVFADGVYTVKPGKTFTVTLNKSAGKGEVTYTNAVLSGAQFVQNSSSNAAKNAFTATAVTGIGGGRVSVSFEVTVTTGAFAGLTKHVVCTVDVTTELLPNVNVVDSFFISRGESSKNLSGFISASGGDGDSEFAYSIEYKMKDGSLGSIQTTSTESRYQAPSKTSTAQAELVETINYTVTVTGGYYKGKTFGGTVTALVMPEAALTADDNVVAGGTLEITPSIATGDNIDTTDYKLTYSVSDSSLGYMQGNTFRANLNGGTAVVTAIYTFGGGKFKGAVVTADCSVTVNALTLSGGKTSIDVTPGKTTTYASLFTSAFAVTETEFTNGAYFESSSIAEFKVKPDANFTGSDIKLTAKITATSGGKTYYGEFVLNIKSVAVPEPTVEYSLDGNVQSGTTVNSMVQGQELKFTVSHDGLSGVSVAASVNCGTITIAKLSDTRFEAVFTANSAASNVTLTLTSTVYGQTVEKTYTVTSITVPSGSTYFITDISSAAPGTTVTATLTTNLSGNYRLQVYYDSSYIQSVVLKSNGNIVSGTHESYYGYYMFSVNLSAKIEVLYALKQGITQDKNLSMNVSVKSAYNNYLYASATVNFKAIKDTPSESDLVLNYPAAVRASETVTFAASASDKFAFAKPTYAVGGTNSSLFTLADNKLSLRSSSIDALTTAQVAVTCRISGKEVSKTVTVTFVPDSSEILFGGNSNPEFMAKGSEALLTLSLAGINNLAFTANGVNVQNALFKPSAAGQYAIAATYTVAGVTFTETASVTVLDPPAVRVQNANGGYKLNVTSGYTDFRYEIIGGADLVTVTWQNKVLTFTQKNADKGGTVVFVLSAKASGGIYDGVEFSARGTHTVTATVTAPTVTAVIASKKVVGDNYVFTLTAAENAANSGTGSFSYAYYGIGTFDQSSMTVTVAMAAGEQTFVGMLAATFNGEYFNGQKTYIDVSFTVPARLEQPVVQLSGGTQDGYSYSFDVSAPDYSQYGTYTVTYAGDGEYANNKITADMTKTEQNLSGTFAYTFTDGDYIGAVITASVSFTVPAAKAPAVTVTANEGLQQLSVTVSDGSTYTVEYTAQNSTVVVVDVDGSYSAANGVTIDNSNASQQISYTVTITDGLFKDKVYSGTVIVTLPLTPEPDPQPDPQPEQP